MPNNVLNFLGEWDSTQNYNPLPFPNLVLIPMIIYNNVIYTWNGSAKPTVGLVPSSDSAWTASYTLPSSIYSTIIGITGNVATGAQTINGGTNYSSSNITVNATSISLPTSRVIGMQAILNVTTATSTGATFAWTATNATINITNTIAVGASVTGGIYFVNGIVTTTTTTNPSIALTASSVTGTPTLNAGTSINLRGLS